jgi:hypothetical protein
MSYHGMDIDWEKMEEVARTSSARDRLIGNAEDRIVEAAVALREFEMQESFAAPKIEMLGPYQTALDTAVDELIALREGQ